MITSTDVILAEVLRLGQRHQRQDPAFTGVICPHHKGEVFKRNDEDQQPEDQGQEAKYGIAFNAKAKLAGQTFHEAYKAGWCRYRRTPRRWPPALIAGNDCLLSVLID